MMDIDLVYLWCSNTDPKFSKALNETRERLLFESDPSAIDYRTSDHNELRYSLRSVEKYAPWVRRIFIVTYNQIPKWLNVDHPKIQIVDHSEIIPSEYLPTFNSNVIESFLHKIPGLAEHFLLVNDDMFFGCETGPEFFFDKNGLPIQYPHFVPKYSNNYYDKILMRAKMWAEKDTKRSLGGPILPSHNIDAYTKTLYADTIDHFWLHYQEMFPNKFRRNNDVQRFLIFCWGKLTDRLVWGKPDPKKLGYIDKMNTQSLEKFLKNKRPNLFCVNDSHVLDESDYLCRSDLLQKLFPEKSAFEKDDKIVIPTYQNCWLKPAFSKKNIPIIFTINEKYIPFCGVTLASLLKNISRRYNYDIIILTNGGNPALIKTLISQKKPKNVSIRTCGVAPLLEEFKGLFKKFPREKTTKWMKLFLPQLLGHYSKAIYLDADLLIKCDVAELWKMNLDDKPVGGILDISVQHLENSGREVMKNVFHCDSVDDYINLGVMVMDLDALRQMNFTQNVLKLLSTVPPNVWNIYSLFNAVLHGNIKLLPMTYNYQYGIFCETSYFYPFFKDEVYFKLQKLNLKGAKIVHFTAVKPWYKITGPEGFSWWKMAKTTDYYEMITLTTIESVAMERPRPPMPPPFPPKKKETNSKHS